MLSEGSAVSNVKTVELDIRLSGSRGIASRANTK